MDAMSAVLLALGALLLGLAVGWFAANRANLAVKSECDQLRERCGSAERETAAASERASQAEIVRAMHAEVVKERDEALRAKAALEADVRNFDARMADLQKSRDSLVTQFREIGDKLLEKAHTDFLAKADDRLAKSDKENSAKLQTLLQPVEATLKRYEEGLLRVEKERIDNYAGLREVVDQMRTGQGQVRDEARRLVHALTSSPKQRGRWGERSLENVLTQSGLVKGVDFHLEVSVDSEEGKLRPDAVIHLPDGRELIVDSKCSLNAFLEGCDAVEDDKRAACFKAHLASILRHAQQLGSKAYWTQFGEAADFVIMYIPGEHFLTAALEQDDELWEKAFRNRVLIATPTNLVGIARTVASVWRQERLGKAAEEIAALGRELHSRIATMGQHLVRMGKNLATANEAYNAMAASLESNVLTQAKRFESYGAGSSKEIPTPPMVEVAPRPLNKLAGPLADDPPHIAAE